MFTAVAACASLGMVGFSACTKDAPPGEKGITIGFSNDMRGEIRSCGCASNDYGGLGRRATFLRTVRDSAQAFVLVDGGGFFGSKLNYGKEKADLTLKSMAMMGYDAVVISNDELGFGMEYIVKRTRDIGLPVIVANLWDAAVDTLYFPATREVTLANGLRVGIIGVMSERLTLPAQVETGSVRVSGAIDAVAQYAPDLRSRVDLLLVLAHVSQREAERMARAVGEIDVIVQGSEGRVMRRPRQVNNAYIVRVSSQGRYMGIAHVRLAEVGGVSSLVSEIAPLTKIYSDDEAISRLFSAYDLNIAAKENTNIPAAIFESRGALEKPFAGAGTCQPCHAGVDVGWKETKHAHAFDILTAQSRGYDRDCTPCHTTGFYKRGGFETLAVTPELVHVQCESCHGNGHDHSRDPSQKTPGDPRKACRACHTVDQTPEFEFDAFWARIRH